METRKNISSNMVITMGLFSREQAEYVRDMMGEGGIKVMFVELQISDEDFIARNKARNRRKADSMGLSMEELWDSRERMKKWGEFSEEREEEYYRRGMVGWETLEGMEESFVINSGGGYQDVVVGVSAVLGLPLVVNMEQEVIAEININRWKNYKLGQNK